MKKKSEDQIVRITISTPKRNKTVLQEEAKAMKRSLSSHVLQILENHIFKAGSLIAAFMLLGMVSMAQNKPPIKSPTNNVIDTITVSVTMTYASWANIIWAMDSISSHIEPGEPQIQDLQLAMQIKLMMRFFANEVRNQVSPQINVKAKALMDYLEKHSTPIKDLPLKKEDKKN